MNDPTRAVQQYLATLHDVVPGFWPTQIQELPLHLSSRYTFLRAELFGQEWLLAIEAEEWEPGTPGEYKKQLQVLSSHTKTPVALVFSSITSTLRNRLVGAKVPFIVPKTQVFLPTIYVSLAERNLNPISTPQKHLTPTAQLLVLYEIIHGGLRNSPFKEVAAALNCSRTMITKARAELESRGICTVERLGKETRMRFADDTRTIWKTALPSLASPVVKTRWIQWDNAAKEAKQAGLTALSDLTLIAGDSIPTYAIYKSRFTNLLEKGMLRGWPDKHGAHAAMQCWSYDPALLSDATHVDHLSLHLSLRMEHNERIQSELESLMETFSWR
jgi:hypothetical protein